MNLAVNLFLRSESSERQSVRIKASKIHCEIKNAPVNAACKMQNAINKGTSQPEFPDNVAKYSNANEIPLL